MYYSYSRRLWQITLLHLFISRKHRLKSSCQLVVWNPLMPCILINVRFFYEKLRNIYAFKELPFNCEQKVCICLHLKRNQNVDNVLKPTWLIMLHKTFTLATNVFIRNNKLLKCRLPYIRWLLNHITDGNVLYWMGLTEYSFA